MHRLAMTQALRHLTLAQIAARWPKRLPMVAFGGSGRWQFVATRFRAVAFEEYLQQSLECRPDLSTPVPFAGGFVGFLSYDDLALLHHGESRGNFAYAHGEQALAASRVFAVEQVLVHDALNPRIWTVFGNDKTAVTHELTNAEWTALALPLTTLPLADLSGIPLVGSDTDAHYESLVLRALDDIAKGRYYQINLLRFFSLLREPNRDWLWARLARLGESHASVLSCEDLDIVSFSPERFVSLEPSAQGLTAVAQPIKGTAPRHLEPALDLAAAEFLRNSTKDKAELHIIVDLLRNDLNQISQRGSVRVLEPLRLDSLTSVHHLSAKISSLLKPGLSWREFWQALGPAGSITGAPKREVISAAREFEGRPRGFFMGNAFYVDRSGRFDSSVLIRTLVRDSAAGFAYAAGSGLTISSVPQTERLEIQAKTRVIQDDI